MIGRGGMGAVYRAHREDNGQVVAVKALLLPLEQERERFFAEIETMKLLRHDNIVRLYGFGQEDGVLYYAMEYVDGPSLSALLKRGRQFSWEEVVYIGASICRALKHAHDRGVIHRDIKPANILLLDKGVVKVSDYGIAQYFGSSRLTGANQVVGTIEYMPPEQARAGALTPHTDMYSLGALMYALLTGKPPYVARDLAQLLQRFNQGAPERIRAIRPEVPQVVEDVVFDLLQIRTDKRPGDARVIGRRLEAILKSLSNCVDGNPFSFNIFSLERKTENAPVEESRVDLARPERDDKDDEMFDVAPDIPYRPVAEDEPEREQVSAFEKTTEVATCSEEPLPSQAEIECRSSDFDLAEEQSGCSRDAATLTSIVGPDALGAEFRLRESVVTSETPTAEEDKVKLPANTNDADANFSLIDEPDSATDVGAAETIAASQVEARPTPPAPELSEREARASAETVVAAVDELDIEPLETIRARAAVETVVETYPQGPGLGVDAFSSSDEMEAVPLEKFKRSRFTPVDESELDSLPSTKGEDARVVWLRVASMLALFFGVVFLFADVFKTPSADKLYARIDRKMSAASPDELESVLRNLKNDLIDFSTWYPNDLRARRVNYFLDELRTVELETRLERQINNSGKIVCKDNVELPYVEACRVAESDPLRGAEMLRAFVVLFGPSGEYRALDQPVDMVFFDDYVSLFLRRTRKNEEKDLNVGTDEKEGREREEKPKRDTPGNLWVRWSSGPEALGTSQEQLIFLAKLRIELIRRQVKKENMTGLALLNDRMNSILNDEDFEPERAESMMKAAEEFYGDRDWAWNALKEYREKIDARLGEDYGKETNDENNENGENGDADAREETSEESFDE